MKLFSSSEANRMIPIVRPKLERLRYLHIQIEEMSEDARAAAAASESGGGMARGPTYVAVLYETGSVVEELNEIGIHLKDRSRGLIDFPSLRDGRIVFLCWQLGEPDTVEWWHETEAGFAGRQRL